MDFTLEDAASSDGSGKGSVEISMFNVGIGTFKWFGKAFSRRRKIAALEKKYQDIGEFFSCSVSDPDDSCLLESQTSIKEEDKLNSNLISKEHGTNLSEIKPRDIKDKIKDEMNGEKVCCDSRNDVNEIRKPEENKIEIVKENEKEKSVNKYLETYDSDIMLQYSSKKLNQNQFENMNHNIIVGNALTSLTQVQSYDLALSNSSIPETISSEPTKTNFEDANDIETISLPAYEQISQGSDIIPFELEGRDIEIILNKRNKRQLLFSLLTQCCCMSYSRFKNSVKYS